jgi:hypothetical protein
MKHELTAHIASTRVRRPLQCCPAAESDKEVAMTTGTVVSGHNTSVETSLKTEPL